MHIEENRNRHNQPRQTSGRTSGYQGRYLSDIQAPRKRRRRRRLNPGFIVTVCLLVTITVGLILIGHACTRQSDVVGRWDMDGTTVYEFYRDGTGVLVLQTMNFEFEYTDKNGVITIDFVDERAKDASYEYVINVDVMMLSGGPGNAVSEFILRRDG